MIRFPSTALLTISAFSCALLHAAHSLAFKEGGHRSIEAAAYRTLLRDDPTVIPQLVRTGVLKAPFRGYPLPSPDFDENFGNYTLNGLLLATGKADHLLDRQLQKDLQCFHFNARGSHVTKVHGTMYGVPRGLVVDAYVECLGVADAILRSVLFAPRGSDESAIGVYTLIHLLEDSYSDAHVARTVSFDKIIYLKPWNVRSWVGYFFGAPNTPNDSLRLQFSDEHHMMADTRDQGYRIGEWDTEGCLPAEYHSECTNEARIAYARRVARCELDVSALLGHGVKVDDLSDDVVLPSTCLSDRGQRAAEAITDLLRLIARHVEAVGPSTGDSNVREVDQAFADEWLEYRRKYLGHVDDRLTKSMADFRVALAVDGHGAPADVRGNFVYPANDLIPRRVRLAGAGLSTELTPGTPLWLGFDAFVASDASAHDSINPFNAIGYAVQLRLPIEDELGEKPIGVAFDIGPGIPIPISELISRTASRFDVFIGARARVSYTAESVFKQNTRHVVQAGLGGLTLDFVVGDAVWFGADFPRFMLRYDTWANQVSYPLYWSVSGGIAADAF